MAKRDPTRGKFQPGNKAAAGTGHNQRAARGETAEKGRPRGRPPTRVVEDMRAFFMEPCEFDDQGRSWFDITLRAYYDALIVRDTNGAPLASGLTVAQNIHGFLFPKTADNAQKFVLVYEEPTRGG
jgi:hypothetical protein